MVLQARRHIIRPNPGFFRQLIEYEARLLGTNTVSMVWNQAAGGHIPDLYEHEYSNTLSYMAKYGNGGGGGHHHHHHGHHRSGAGSSSSTSSKMAGGPPTSGLLGSSIGGRGDAGSGWSHLHSSSAYRRLWSVSDEVCPSLGRKSSRRRSMISPKLYSFNVLVSNFEKSLYC